jgi:DNA-binding response OmpR family regulator
MKSFAPPHTPVQEVSADTLVAWRLLPPRTEGQEGRLLLVDADQAEAARAAALFREHRFEVEVAADLPAAEQALAAAPVDLVVLEPAMPDADGLGFCRRLALEGQVPVLILAARCEPLDRVIGLELGADDVLAKDAHPLELVARVRAALRRRSSARRAAPAPPRARPWNGFRVEVRRRRLHAPDGRRLDLSAGEARLLALLFAHPHKVFGRDELMARAWPARVSGRAVDVMACRLRRRLEAFTGLRLIVSQRGVGYALQADA